MSTPASRGGARAYWTLRGAGRCRRPSWTVLLCAVSVCAHLTAQTTASESKLKAAFVSKFPQFVEWPPSVFDRDAVLNVCVPQPDPFGADLDELVAGQSLNGHSMAVKRIDRDGDLAACHVLFLPSSGQTRQLLQKAAALPILTIGDDRRFVAEGGIIGLRMVGGRVRFEVGAGAAARAGLRLSSQLLQLALSVDGGTR